MKNQPGSCELKKTPGACAFGDSPKTAAGGQTAVAVSAARRLSQKQFQPLVGDLGGRAPVESFSDEVHHTLHSPLGKAVERNIYPHPNGPGSFRDQQVPGTESSESTMNAV